MAGILPVLWQEFSFEKICSDRQNTVMLFLMLTFLFWNLAKRVDSQIVASLVKEHDVDVLLLAENAIPPAELLGRLNANGVTRYNFVPSIVQTKVDIFFGFLPEYLKPHADESRASIRRVVLPAREEFLLGAVHLPSLMHWTEADQLANSAEINAWIRQEELKAGHFRTIVVGDFNMNPFSPGLVSANGFNAVMTRDVALQGSRKVQDREYPFFFNPMWSHFADGQDRSGGTFYFHPKGYQSIYWHILDQVLVRPELVPYFDQATLKILDSHARGSLLGGKKRPEVSDHLPILFKMRI